MQVLVLQHIACEPPGVYEDVLRERGANIHRVELDENDPLPPWRGFDAVIAMGGPMNVNDDERLPWLRDEKALICDAVRAGVPYFGACLGAQLLAASLGGKVFQGEKPEVGLLPVFFSSGAIIDPVFFRHSAPAAYFSMALRHLHAASGVGIAGEFAGLRQPSIPLG
jgi:GMP synthase (glutamine-hydrolysing)